MEKATFKDINDYISKQPSAVSTLLEQMRQIVRAAAPDAEETISYQMPAFRQHGMLVYFAGWKNHIGFYPASSGISVFSEELAPYKFSKGTIHFPLGRPLLFDLITRIVKFRVEENVRKAAHKVAEIQKKNK